MWKDDQNSRCIFFSYCYLSIYLLPSTTLLRFLLLNLQQTLTCVCNSKIDREGLNISQMFLEFSSQDEREWIWESPAVFQQWNAHQKLCAMLKMLHHKWVNRIGTGFCVILSVFYPLCQLTDCWLSSVPPVSYVRRSRQHRWRCANVTFHCANHGLCTQWIRLINEQLLQLSESYSQVTRKLDVNLNLPCFDIKKIRSDHINSAWASC